MFLLASQKFVRRTRNERRLGHFAIIQYTLG